MRYGQFDEEDDGKRNIDLPKECEFGKKAFLEKPVVGHWYKFDHLCVGQDEIGYGKVTKVNDDGSVDVEKYFHLPSYRPYAATKWFDYLPFAIA